MSKKKYRTVYIVSCIALVISLILCCLYFVHIKLSEKQAEDTRSIAHHDVSDVNSEFFIKENPIDFASLQDKNTDIYAWIKVPGTDVDYPVVQSYKESDYYYLNHDINKNYSDFGSIYTEKLNTKTFNDRNTLIYGHNMLNGSMFATLHRFRDEKFFKSHDKFKIYTDGHILTYKIFAAYKSDARHILNSYDFSDDEIWLDYLETCQNPKSLICYTRKVNLNIDSKIVTLSTCIGNESDYRYLVQGVLTDDTLTK